MRTFAELLFDWGYFREAQGAVKSSFLSWYYEATQSERIQEGLQADNSELSELAIQSAKQAENFEQENEVSELIRILEDFEQRINTTINYAVLFTFFIAGGAAAADVFYIADLFSSAIIRSIAGILSVSTVVVYAFYRVVVHQIKSNSELIKKFNQKLSTSQSRLVRTSACCECA